MTVTDPPDTTPNTPIQAPDPGGGGQEDGKVKYDDNGNYLYTIGGEDDPNINH